MIRLHDLMRRIKVASRLLAPIPVPVRPRLEPLVPIRAVIFDIYGTLLVSGSGDVGTIRQENSSRAAEEAFKEAGFIIAGKGCEVTALMKEIIGRHHRARKDAGSLNPEVDIRDVWSDVSTELVDWAILERCPSRSLIEVISVEYECRNNPVWPMPGITNTIAELRKRGIVMGIISNAQFFTPLFVEALIGKDLASLGFRPDRTVFSYQLLEAKPSVSLFQSIVDSLAREVAIPPSEILYVGNDMRNDILPASRLGLRTALFAGDARSYRPRTGDPSCAGVEPDFVVTRLEQIPDVCGDHAW